MIIERIGVLLLLCLANGVVGGMLLMGMNWPTPRVESVNISGTSQGSGYHIALHENLSQTEVDTLSSQVTKLVEASDSQLSPLIHGTTTGRLSCDSSGKPVYLGDNLSLIVDSLLMASHWSKGAFNPYRHVAPERCSSLLSVDSGNTNESLEVDPHHISALPFAGSIIPQYPIGLDMNSSLNGLQVDQLDHFLHQHHHHDFRLDVGGIMLVSEGQWPIALSDGDVVDLKHQVLLHGTSKDGDTLWLVASSGLRGSAEMNALSSLTTEAGYQLAHDNDWNVRWYKANHMIKATGILEHVSTMKPRHGHS